MYEAPRRGFLKVAGAGVAAAGAATVTAASASAATPMTVPAGAEGALVAYITDVKRGEISVMVEGREVVITDHDLVARLAHAIHARTGRNPV
jgi:hypothetical protein